MCLQLSSCCFCVSLDVGSKVISIFSLIFSVVIAMLYGTAALMPYLNESRKIVYAIVANITMFQILIECLLIYGVFGKKPRLILPWLVTSWIICICLLGLSALGTVLIILQYTGDEETSEVSTTATAYGTVAVVKFYFASVISSRREEMLYYDVSDSAQGLMRRDFMVYKV